MEELDVDQVYDIFMEELRKGDGLTTKKLRKHPELITLLVDDGTPEDAKAELEAIVLSRGDGNKARALRNSLVVSNGQDGIEPRGGPELRRRWATGADDSARPRLIPKSIGSHVAYEKEEFREVAELIFDRAVKRTRSKTGNGAFQATGEQQLTELGHTAAFSPAEPIDMKAALLSSPPLSDDQLDQDEPPDQPVSPALVKIDSFFRDLRGALSRHGSPPLPADPENLSVLQTLRIIVTEKGQKKPIPSTERQYRLRVMVVAGTSVLVAIFMAVVITLALTGVIHLHY